MAQYAFEFNATGDAPELCENTVERMMELFGISVEEVGRVNRKWAGRDLDEDSRSNKPGERRARHHPAAMKGQGAKLPSRHARPALPWLV